MRPADWPRSRWWAMAREHRRVLSRWPSFEAYALDLFDRQIAAYYTAQARIGPFYSEGQP